MTVHEQAARKKLAPAAAEKTSGLRSRGPQTLGDGLLGDERYHPTREEERGDEAGQDMQGDVVLNGAQAGKGELPNHADFPRGGAAADLHCGHAHAAGREVATAARGVGPPVRCPACSRSLRTLWSRRW